MPKSLLRSVLPSPLHRHLTLLAGAMLFAVPATAQYAGQANDARSTDIVVMGKSLKQTAADLAACLARGCPPDEDIAATLAHTENQFLGGDYKGARTTLMRSVGRNRRHGAAYPVPVSDLFRANSRVAEHVGEAKNFQLAVLDMRNVLRSGLGENDPRAMVAQIEVGDSRAKLGFPDEARRIYRDVEQAAIAANQPRVAMFSRLRRGLLAQMTAEASQNPAEQRDARMILQDMIDNPIPGGEEFILPARVILARADRKAGNQAATEAILREFAQAGGTNRPLLLFSEPIKRIDLSQREDIAQPDPSVMLRLMALNSVAKWADVGFWVGVDGRVRDVEVLRSEGGESWLKPVFAQIQNRIYAPLKADGNDGVPGFFMIERYSLTARWTNDATGTHLRRREPTARIERLDITPDNYDKPLAR